MELHVRGFEQARSASRFIHAASASSGGLKYVSELMKWSTKAEEMARRALAIQRKEFGSESLEVAASLNLLGLQLMTQHKLPEAEQVDSEALAIRRRRLGDNNADTATSLNDLAAVYRDQRKLTNAE